MKIINKCITIIFLALWQNAQAQDFVNLNFEDATITTAPGFPFYVLQSDAIPGWTATPVNDLGGNLYIGYDTVSLGGAAVFLEDANAPSGGGPLPIQGNYSVLLEFSSASIGQTGTIPTTAQSLTFFAEQGALQVTFNGQNIPFSAIGNGAGYTIYGADIASYAGQTGELLFTTPSRTSALLDNIQFSSSPIPEPSTLALGALSAVLLGFRGWKNSSR